MPSGNGAQLEGEVNVASHLDQKLLRRQPGHECPAAADTAPKTPRQFIQAGGVFWPRNMEGHLAFVMLLRARWLGGCLHLALDNYSVNKCGEVRKWCVGIEVELFVPNHSSWLNLIECEFAAFRCFALNGTDRRSHVVQAAAIGGNTRWHNQRAPDPNFTVGAKIRRSYYPTKVA
ncbi:hypothetical protein ACFTS5_07300 [Nocardia sp. NPDC056952]|uniref:hypothetical protein n=1 Tax=Nocardia sp. NPDC056952 TaxID=3345979 RepID=UPI003636C6F8